MSPNLLGVSGGVVVGISRNVKKTVGAGGAAGESFSDTDPAFASPSTDKGVLCAESIYHLDYLDSGTFFAVSGRPGDHPPFLETPGNSGTLARSVFRSRIPTYASQDRSNANYMV